MQKLNDMAQNKHVIQQQINEREKLREEAYEEYQKEKNQVDAVI